MRTTKTSTLLMGAAITASLGLGQTFVTIPTSNNIQTALISTVPTGTFTAANALATQFSIPSAAGTCGPSGNSPCNYYDGFTGNGQSITMTVSVPNATDAYTLMNAYGPPPGVTIGTVKFTGTGATQITFNLVAGQDIRDFYQGSFANTLSNGVSGVTALNAFTCSDPATCLGGGATGNVNTGDAGTYVVDEQHFSLGSTFAGQTLTQIVITDTNNDGSVPILLGATVGPSGTGTPATPLPPSIILLTIGLAGLGLYRFCRTRNA